MPRHTLIRVDCDHADCPSYFVTVADHAPMTWTCPTCATNDLDIWLQQEELTRTATNKEPDHAESR